MNNIYSGLASLGFSYLMKKKYNNLTRIILNLNEHNLKFSRYAIFSKMAEINGFQIVRKKDFYSPIPVVDELPDEAFSPNQILTLTGMKKIS